MSMVLCDQFLLFMTSLVFPISFWLKLLLLFSILVLKFGMSFYGYIIVFKITCKTGLMQLRFNSSPCGYISHESSSTWKFFMTLHLFLSNHHFRVNILESNTISYQPFITITMKYHYPCRRDKKTLFFSKFQLDRITFLLSYRFNYSILHVSEPLECKQIIFVMVTNLIVVLIVS